MKARSLGFVLASFFACCGGGASHNAVRLMDPGQDVQIEWPRVGKKKYPVPADRNVTGAFASRQARVVMTAPDGYDCRTALLAPTPSRYRFKLKLPSRPILRVGLGLVAEQRAVRFTVGVAAEGGAPRSLFDRTITGEEGRRWSDVEIRLGRWAGKHVTLELSASGAEGRGWGAWANPVIVSGSGPDAGPDVILISLDTLRADRLGCYGYSRPTSPNLDRFAAESVLFRDAVSSSPWTLPSHRALFTGLNPASHHGYTRRPIAEILTEAGYHTAALTGGGQLDYRLGFDRGFEVYGLKPWIHAPEQVAAYMDANRGRPLFFFLHTYEVHDPYKHDELAAGMEPGRVRPGFSKTSWGAIKKTMTEKERDYVSALYDSGIAYTDRRLGELFDALKKRGILERAIVIVTSDHGEQFWEHGSWNHGQNLYDPQLRVPLIIHLPREIRTRLGAAALPPGGAIAQQVQLIDVVPTLADLLRIPLRHQLQGRSLVPLLAGGALEPRDAFAEHTNVGPECKGLRSSRYKFIYSFPRGAARGAWSKTELYDLQADPAEQIDLSPQQPELTAALLERVRNIMRGSEDVELDGAVPPDADQELRDQLRALGYTGD